MPGGLPVKFEDQRNLMVQNQLTARGIANQRLLDIFLSVPRHEFVPEEMRAYSYNDHPLAIGDGQTISQPYIVALMVDLLQVRPTHHVLEIGTGSGYQTAILSLLAQQVYTVERLDSLMRRARRDLKRLGYANVHFRTGDGTRGWEKAYPARDTFDRIVVSAAAPHAPEQLIGQLAEGGRLVIPVGSRLMQELVLIRRENGEIITENHGGCAFVPLIGEDGWANE